MLSSEEIAQYAGVEWGYRVAAPLAEMNKYLRWLYRQVWTLGARLVFGRIRGLEELSDDVDVIVNCAGLGARDLVEDPDLQAVRGQYLVLERPDGIDGRYVGDDENPGGMTYVIPRRSDVCIGGTEEYGKEKLEFSVNVTELLERAAALVPWLRSPDLVALRETRVGLRPWRPDGVRFGVGPPAGELPVINNYGHGGSGFSLAWGCAQDVVQVVRALH